MPRFAFATPVLPGKDARVVPEMLRGRKDEYEASRRNAGLSVERAYLQATPMGEFVVVYMEADRDFAAINQASATSGLALDRDFLALVSEVHGIDFSQPGPTPGLETVGEWNDPEVAERRPGIAFVAPLNPGAAEATRAFAREAFQTRRDQFTASRRALGVSREVVTVQQTPEGDVLCGYFEAHDPVGANRGFAASQSEFDSWFKGELTKLFPPFVDFSQPLPPISTIWDWHRAAVNA